MHRTGPRRSFTRAEVLRLMGAATVAAVVCPARAADNRGFLEEIAPDVFVHRGHIALMTAENGGDIANLGLVVGSKSAAVIDTGGSAEVGAAFRQAIAAVTPLPVSHVINTHMHPDHVFGNAAFEPDKPAFVAHAKLARGLAARADDYLASNRERMGEAALAGTRIVLPTVAVEDTLTIDLGERKLLLKAWKTAHTDNDLTVLDTASGTLFVGDLLFVDHIPVLDGSIRGWLDQLPLIAKEPAARAVPGHGPAVVNWPDALAPETHYLETVASDVRQSIKDGRTLPEAVATAGQSEKDKWLLFSAYHPRNVTAAYAELEWE